MKLRRVDLQDVRGITTAFNLDASVPVVVTGPPGAGKTTVLESIIAAKEAAGGYGAAPLVRDFQLNGRGGTIAVDFELDDAEQRAAEASRMLTLRWDLSDSTPQAIVPSPAAAMLRDFECSPQSWKMEYLHASRQLADMGSIAWTDASARLSKRPGKYGWVRRFLVESTQHDAGTTLRGLREHGIVLGADARPRTGRFAAALTSLTSRLAWVGCEDVAGETACIFARATGTEVELAALADSEKMAVLVAAACAALGLDRSLVLIDHPELHLHPEVHLSFFQGICSLFAEGQVVVTTSSPAILRAVRREQVVVLGPEAPGANR